MINSISIDSMAKLPQDIYLVAPFHSHKILLTKALKNHPLLISIVFTTRVLTSIQTMIASILIMILSIPIVIVSVRLIIVSIAIEGQVNVN